MSVSVESSALAKAGNSASEVSDDDRKQKAQNCFEWRVHNLLSSGGLLGFSAETLGVVPRKGRDVSLSECTETASFSSFTTRRLSKPVYP